MDSEPGTQANLYAKNTLTQVGDSDLTWSYTLSTGSWSYTLSTGSSANWQMLSDNYVCDI